MPPGRTFFPILGAIKKARAGAPYVLSKRTEVLSDPTLPPARAEYVYVRIFVARKISCFLNKPPPLLARPRKRRALARIIISARKREIYADTGSRTPSRASEPLSLANCAEPRRVSPSLLSLPQLASDDCRGRRKQRLLKYVF